MPVSLAKLLIHYSRFCPNQWHCNQFICFSGFRFVVPVFCLYCFFFPYCCHIVFVCLYCCCVVFVFLCWLYNRHLWC